MEHVVAIFREIRLFLWLAIPWAAFAFAMWLYAQGTFNGWALFFVGLLAGSVQISTGKAAEISAGKEGEL